MIRSGDKNTNVFDIINQLSGKRYPSNDGIDDYTANEPYVEYPRDEREHNPLEVINSDETKPLDGEDLITRVRKIENSFKLSGDDNNNTNNENMMFITTSTPEEFKSACENCEEFVKLNDNIVVSEQMNITGPLMLDLNGQEIKNETDIYNVNNQVWSLVSAGVGSDLIIDGNGSFVTKENDCYAVDVRGGGKCTIKNGTFVGNISSVYVYEGSVEITGGKFSIQQLSEFKDHRYLLNCYDQNYKSGKASIVVKGGEFINFDPSNNTSEGEGTNYVAEGYKVVSETLDNGDVLYKVISE